MRINHKSFVALLVFAFVLFQSLQSPSVQRPQIVQKAPTPTVVQSQTYLVTRVIDGDTIEIQGGKRVRYIGMDSPELHDENKKLLCFGKEALEKNKELVLGKQVRMEKDISETDQFERLLRYVYVQETFINEQLVKEGFAHVATYPPDIKYWELLQNAEQIARKNNRGLWNMCGQ